MSKGKSILGAMALCALALGIVGASTASAAGLTAVTCKEAVGGPGTGNFETNHCETPEVAKSNFETVPIPLGTATPVTSEQIGTTVLTGTILFVKTEITCEEGHATGKVTNEEVGGVMQAHGTEVVIHYTKCHAKLASSGSGETCKVRNGHSGTGNLETITTTRLTTVTTGVEHNVTIKPEGGTVFMEYELLNEASEGHTCSIPSTAVTVTGELNAVANTTKHSHLTLEPATNGGKFTANGGPMTYTGTIAGYMEEAGGVKGNTVGLTTF